MGIAAIGRRIVGIWTAVTVGAAVVLVDNDDLRKR